MEQVHAPEQLVNAFFQGNLRREAQGLELFVGHGIVALVFVYTNGPVGEEVPVAGQNQPGNLILRMVEGFRAAL